MLRIPIDKGWQFKQAGDGDGALRPVARFPTTVHVDLLHHGLIPDPRVGTNERAVQWVGETAWVYRAGFAAPGPRGGRRAALVFDGLDTFAAVALNGEPVLRSDNMFVPARADVSDVLRWGAANELEITFDAAYRRGWEAVDARPEHRWGCWNGDASRLAVRKAQYHWGWDWGPTLLTCGPWRPVALEVFGSRLCDLHADVDVDGDLGGARVVAHAAAEGPAARVRFDISLAGRAVASETVAVAAAGSASAAFRVQSPELWYPARHGRQPLYEVRAALLDGAGAEADCLTRRIGLRRVELRQRPLAGQPGSSFFFAVNNVPVFCGGSNWIPADSFTPRLSRDRYRDWVRLAAAGNQLMLRVWGGGIYEEQALYDACDEAGILVWQDFMFACGNYPADAAFRASVEREARANVCRLRHHPCIVVWAGNNEDYQYAESEGLAYDPLDPDPARWLASDFPARYIYEKTLPDVCRDLVPRTPYHPGSPWGGRRTTDPTAGDLHQWNVWHGSQEPWQRFDRLAGRFVSEFGMQALPSVRTVDAWLPGGRADRDRHAQSATVDWHNKAAGHARRIALYLADNFRYATEPLEHFVYCTQLMQAECLGAAFRLWRREWRGPGREFCGGALLWQLDDCWPATSWAICDYFLRPKLAYYVVKRELAPLSVGVVRRDHTRARSRHSRVDVERRVRLDLWGSNLALDDVTADCVVKAWDVETGHETYSATVSPRLLLPANRSTDIIAMDVPVAAPGAGLEDRTVVAAYLFRDGALAARCVNWPEPLKHLHLQKPRLLRADLSGDAAAVLVSAEVPVKGVAVECDDDGVSFDDNLVDVVPGETLRIGVDGATRDTAFTTQYLGMLAP